MRDWLLIVGGNVISVIGSISITPENFTAWFASVAGATITIVVGVSRIRQQREARLSAQEIRLAKEAEKEASLMKLDVAKYDAILRAREVCDACLKRDVPFKNCGILKEYCERNGNANN